jgi:hypothetical protein
MPRTTKIRGGNGNWFSRKFGSFKQLFRGRAARDAEIYNAVHRQNSANQQPAHRSGMFTMVKRPNAVDTYHEAVQYLDKAKESHKKLKEAQDKSMNIYLAKETLLSTLNNAEDAYTKAWNESVRAYKNPPPLKHGYAWMALPESQKQQTSEIKNLVKNSVEEFQRSQESK